MIVTWDCESTLNCDQNTPFSGMDFVNLLMASKVCCPSSTRVSPSTFLGGATAASLELRSPIRPRRRRQPTASARAEPWAESAGSGEVRWLWDRDSTGNVRCGKALGRKPFTASIRQGKCKASRILKCVELCWLGIQGIITFVTGNNKHISLTQHVCLEQLKRIFLPNAERGILVSILYILLKIMKLEPTCPLSTTQVEKLPEPGLFLSAYLLGFMSYLWSNVVAAKTCTISISSNSGRSFLKSDSLAALLGHGKKRTWWLVPGVAMRANRPTPAYQSFGIRLTNTHTDTQIDHQLWAWELAFQSKSNPT